MARSYKEDANTIILQSIVFKAIARVAMFALIIFILLLLTWLITETFRVDELLVFLFLIWIPYNFIKVGKVCIISNDGYRFVEKSPWQPKKKIDLYYPAEKYKYIVMSRTNAGSVGGDSGGHNFHLFLSPAKDCGPYSERILSLLSYYGSKDPKDIVTLARKIHKLTGQQIIIDQDFDYAYQEYFSEQLNAE